MPTRPDLVRLPDGLLRPAECDEFLRAQVRLADAEEFIELRRLDGRCRQHRVGLPAVVDLMLEEMHQKAVAPFALHGLDAIDLDDCIAGCVGECVAVRDQAPVEIRLRAFQCAARRIGHAVLPGFRAECAALECIDVEQVDDADVVQGLLQARKEAGTFSLEFRLAQAFAGRQQTVVGPRVIVGEGAKGLHEARGHEALRGCWTRSLFVSTRAERSRPSGARRAIAARLC